MSNPSFPQPLIRLVEGELSKNRRETESSIDLTDGEKATLKRWIDDARGICGGYLKIARHHDSVRGDLIKKKVYHKLKSDVDFVTRTIDGGFQNVEAKFAIKPNAYGPFSSSRNFINLVSVKFDQLETELTADQETFSNVRFLIVSNEHFESLRPAIVDLGNAEEVCSSDGGRHAYALCTLSGLIKLMSASPNDEMFEFEL